MSLITAEQAIEEFRQGKFLIIVDDARRENEGDLAIAAEKITPEAINFMTKFGRGLLCMPVSSDYLERLNLPMMPQVGQTSESGTAFSASIDYMKDTTTGISAHDRSATVKAVIDLTSKPEDFAQPGHTFPLRYMEGGVLVRAGHTEASVDLAIMAKLQHAAVVCEILSDDGTMARLPDLEVFSKEQGINIVSIADIISHRRLTENLIEKTVDAKLPTKFGDFKVSGYSSRFDSDEHVALVMGKWEEDEDVLVRVHSQCFTGDIFGSLRCDCGTQVNQALQTISKEGKGVFLYMRQEGRGIGLHNKIRAYNLQDQGLDTVEANKCLGFEPDLRHYGVGAQILWDLGVRKIRLLTNNPKKIVGLNGFGLEVIDRVPMSINITKENKNYVKAKQEKFGHIIGLD
tara:strand:- start:27 stop:1232 length:1206 start_codon:yes stop_codon:yes gene_type:complete